MYKGYKVRLFPTPEQEELLWKHIHACRFIWNYMLNMQQEKYNKNEKYVRNYDMNRLVTQMRHSKEYCWLKQVSHDSLCITCRDLDKAFMAFFNKTAKHPNFRSKKHSKYSFPLKIGIGKLYFQDGLVTVPFIKKMKYKTDLNLPQGRNVRFINPRIVYKNNKWLLCFSLEFEKQELCLTDYNMGIDLGIKELAVISYQDEKIVFHNINKTKRVIKLENKLKHICRVTSRKYKANNYQKTKGVIRYEKIMTEIYYKLSNIRSNYIHQTTHTIISMLPKKIVMEELGVSDMMKNKSISKKVADQNFYEFIRQVKYKCEQNGIEFVQADKYFPSSKTCSCCGHIKKNLKLSDRVYKCSKCGLEIDRDYNAAINLMNYEKAL